MAQTGSSREEKIAEQRQADNDNAYFAQSFANQASVRQQVVAEQRQADNDNEEAQVEEQERIAEEKSAKDQRRLTVLKILDLKRKHISEAEFELGEEKRTKPTLFRYAPAICIAVLKDLLDLAGFSLPGISFVVTSLFFILMFVALYLAKTNRSLFEIKKVATIIVVYILEAFGFVVNLLPMQTILVFVIFFLDKLTSNKLIAKAIQVLDNIKKD